MNEHYDYSENGIITSNISTLMEEYVARRRREILTGSVTNTMNDVLYKYLVKINPQDFYESFFFINRRKDLQKELFKNDSFSYIQNQSNINKLSRKITLKTNYDTDYLEYTPRKPV